MNRESVSEWDSDGPIAEVTIRIPKTQVAEAHEKTFKIWQRVSEDVHPCAEVHFDNGVGVDGVLVRYKDRRSRKWRRIEASEKNPKGAKGQARVREVWLGRKHYYFHRLVANAFHGMDIRSKAEVCHIVARGKDEHPNDAAANLYVGTRPTNAKDRDYRGPKQGCSVPFEGKKPGDDGWTRFATQEEAANIARVGRVTVTDALRLGLPNTGPDDWTFRWIPMIFDDPEEIASVPFDESRKRVLTSFGREGRIARSGSSRYLVETGQRGTDHAGYTRVAYTDRDGVKRFEMLHRLMSWFSIPRG